MFRVISLNANGIRAASRKGFFDWLPKQDADVICIQETKAQVHQLEGKPEFFPEGYHCFYHDAQKPGYSGVAIYSKEEPLSVTEGIDDEMFDSEGRWIEAHFEKVSVASLYLPSGSSKEERQNYKFEVMDWFMQRLQQMRDSDREWIICGDWNIAHKKIDIKNWRGNQKNSGFLPEERAWLDDLFGEQRWVDAFREVDDREHQYTWWSNRGRAWDNNTGWRIDYQVVTPGLKDQVRAASIYKDERFSDHAPLTLDYAL